MFTFKRPDCDYAGYIFDCDGTLADSMPLHFRAWNHGLEAGGARHRLDPHGFMTVAGMALAQTVEHWTREYGEKINLEAVVAAKNEYFEKHRGDIVAIEPIIAFAEDLKAAGKPIAVASGGRRDDVVATLRHIGARDLFDIIVTADDVATAKPAPDLFLLAAERMGVSPEQCYVIEDSDLGIEAADRAGMDSVRIPSFADLAEPR